MTPQEIRKLIGGYATGSLSDAERQSLFEAALEDQELFDELMREHALKELLEDPGAKARLIAALAPAQRPRPLGSRVWPWAAAGGAVAAGVVLSFALFGPPSPRRMARVFSPPPPRVVEPVPSPLLAPPELRIETETKARRLLEEAARKAERKSFPPPAAAARAPAPRAESVDAATAAAPGEPSPPGAQTPAPPAREFARGIFSPFRQAAATLNFTYTLSGDGKLRITPSANGFLTVISNAAQVVASNRGVQASVAADFTIPADANLVTVFLTPQPSPPLAPPSDAKVVRIPVKPREEK